MGHYGDSMLQLDMDQFETLLGNMAATLTAKQYRRVMIRALRRSGNAVKTAVAREVYKEYHIPYSSALHSMGSPRITSMTSAPSMNIYVKGKRERIGPTGPYPAWSQGANTSSGRKRKRAYSRSGNVTMEDVRGVKSTLPAGVGTDARHFMVMSGKYAGRVFAAIPKTAGGSLFKVHTRGKRICRYQRSNETIRPAVGIAIPQMPLNRATPGIQARFVEIFQKRVMHEWQNVMAGIAQEGKI